jgi:hypothetical protein
MRVTRRESGTRLAVGTENPPENATPVIASYWRSGDKLGLTAAPAIGSRCPATPMLPALVLHTEAMVANPGLLT